MDSKIVQFPNSPPKPRGPDLPPTSSGALSRRKPKLARLSCAISEDTERQFVDLAKKLCISRSGLLRRLVLRCIAGQSNIPDIRIERIKHLVNELSVAVLGAPGGKTA